jgi:hypothetical protein
VEAVKAEAEGKGGAALGLKVYYEVPLKELVKEAKGENRQTKEVRLDEAVVNKVAGNKIAGDIAAGNKAVGEIIVEGSGRLALDEAALTREKLESDYGFSAGEAQEAQGFLHSIRFSGTNSVVPVFLAEAMSKGKAGSYKELRHNILSALDAYQGTAYNLAGEEGMKAYFEGSRARGVDRNEVEAILSEELTKTPYTAVPSFLVTKLEPRYRAQGGEVSFTRSTPRGSPEKIRLERQTGSYAAAQSDSVSLPGIEGSFAVSGPQALEPIYRKITRKAGSNHEEAPVVAFERYAGKAGGKGVPLPGAHIAAAGGVSGANTPIETGNAIGNAMSNTSPAQQFPKRQAGDTELERLRRIEVNYERDKAALAREKQPALARSESRDVGHAQGSAEAEAGQTKQFIRELSDKVVGSLKNKVGC